MQSFGLHLFRKASFHACHARPACHARQIQLAQVCLSYAVAAGVTSSVLPSLLTLEYRNVRSLSPEAPLQAMRLRLQRPTFVVDVGFIMSVLNFVVPTFSMQAAVPQPFFTKCVIDLVGCCCAVSSSLLQCFTADLSSAGSASSSACLPNRK